jgi:UPF0755 protein
MALTQLFRGVVPVLLALVLMTVGIRAYLQSTPPASGEANAAPTIVYIKPKTGVQEIAQILQQAGVIRSAWAFLGLAYLQGSLRRLHSGEYEFRPNMTLLEILRKLEAGRVVTHQVTIPEGFTTDEIATLLASERLVDPERFLALAQNATVAERLNVPATRFEGYLFPDTYRLTRGMGEEEILRLMVERFRRAIPEDMAERAERLRMDLHEIVTLASIIEKEAQLDNERPLVSAVFHNRLRLRMPLQSDPTAVYMVPRGRRRITTSDLQRKSPYNTYLVLGLPPGPIANPGLASLRAALNPAPVNFLYFVAKNDGSHHFSRTLEQHQQAVRLYQGGGRSGQEKTAPTDPGPEAETNGQLQSVAGS